MSAPWYPEPTTLVEGPERAPRLLPGTYPGAPPATSVVQMLHEEPVITLSGDPLGDLAVGEVTLDTFLRDRGAAPIADRHAVLAIGSNACGAQMRHKALSERSSLVVPMMKAEMTGAQITHAPLLCSLGYLPATLAPLPGFARPVHVQFLDEPTLEALDRTEVGYRRVELPDHLVSVTLASGQRLAAVFAYVAEAGFLVDSTSPDPRTPLGLLPQHDVLRMLRAASPELAAALPASAHDALARARADRVWRSVINNLVAAADVAAPYGWFSPDPEASDNVGRAS